MKINLPKLIPYRKADKWGFCDENKNLIIPVKYDSVGTVSYTHLDVYKRQP